MLGMTDNNNGYKLRDKEFVAILISILSNFSFQKQLLCTEDTVARITQSREDVVLLIQAFVQ